MNLLRKILSQLEFEFGPSLSIQGERLFQFDHWGMS